MPYRFPSPPWATLAPEPSPPESPRRRRHAAKRLAAAVASVAILVGGVDLATRPRLGPDLEEPVARDRLITMSSHEIAFGPMRGCGESEPSYDVGRALRSDEPTRAEDLEPEGSGPARRRYVRDDPDQGVIRGSVSLVRDVPDVADVLDVSARPRRRRPQGP